jgi:phage shock protein PspC (stress-responsive transcriptional regulator)
VPIVLCPYCRTENAPGATRCARCTSWMTQPPPAREWMRPRTGAWLGGVARGLADRFGVPPAAVRLAFVVAALVGGWGVVVYLALWILMPREPLALPAPAAATAEQQPAQRAP